MCQETKKKKHIRKQIKFLKKFSRVGAEVQNLIWKTKLI